MLLLQISRQCRSFTQDDDLRFDSKVRGQTQLGASYYFALSSMDVPVGVKGLSFSGPVAFCKGTYVPTGGSNVLESKGLSYFCTGSEGLLCG